MSEEKKTSKFLEDLLLDMVKKRLIEYRTENNKHLKLSYKGKSALFNNKWNIKIYDSGKIVCTDIEHLRQYARDKLRAPDGSLTLIKVDDSGWGFPLCGILVGLTDGEDVFTGEIGVEYFKPVIYERKDYLKAYSEIGIRILNQRFKARSKTHRIEICNGFVNSELREDLRKSGFDVRTVEIKGLLQNTLENIYKRYVEKQTGVDLAYDPKKITKESLVFNYEEALQWGIQNAPHLLKSGWKSMIENGITG